MPGDPAAASAWLVAFTLVLYLALRDGGYDIVVRSEAGIIVWWIVLLCALAGILRNAIGYRGWIAIGLLTGFALWTGLATSWSESAEQTVIELGRIAAYLGVLVLAIAIQGRVAARHTLAGLACAIGLVTALAVLSRLHPQAFGASQHFRFLGAASARKLSYPLNYWNALADFAAMGVPLLLWAAVGAKATATRAVAAAVMPLSAICIYLTVSRGGVIALGVGMFVFVVLIPRRLEAGLTLLISGAGAAVLLRATASDPALTSGISSHAARSEGSELLWLTVIVCLAVGLLHAVLSRTLSRSSLPALVRPSRRAMGLRALTVAAVVVIAATAVGVPSKLEHAWHDFKQPSGVVVPNNENSLFSRLQAANGNNRYQIWQAALNANATHPWRGIGPGTFQFWWAQHATAGGFIRNAHSLYLETLAETGIIGLALLGGLLLWFVATALWRVLTEPAEVRLLLAGAFASLAVFLFAATVEWVWQLATIAATALILGAVIVAGRPEAPEISSAETRDPVRGVLPRAALAVLAIAALGAILVPLAGALAVRDSQAAAARGQLATALRDSLAAQQLQPYASSAHLQEALVLEAAGDLRAAAAAARTATVDSPTDWTTWLTLARIDARRGATRQALIELQQARRLDPRSILFTLP